MWLRITNWIFDNSLNLNGTYLQACWLCQKHNFQNASLLKIKYMLFTVFVLNHTHMCWTCIRATKEFLWMYLLVRMICFHAESVEKKVDFIHTSESHHNAQRNSVNLNGQRSLDNLQLTNNSTIANAQFYANQIICFNFFFLISVSFLN